MPQPGDYLRLHPTQFTGAFYRESKQLQTQKQTHGSYQNEKTKKYGPNERTEQNSKRITKQNGIIKLSDAEFKTLVSRMLKELIGYFNSMKKTQAKMKFTLSEKSTGKNQ